MPRDSDIDACTYLEMQDHLLKVFRVISCHESNFGTYSIRLCTLLLEAGTFFDSLAQSFIRAQNAVGITFQNQSAVPDFAAKVARDRNFTAGDYRALFEPEFSFSTRTLWVTSYGDRFFAEGFTSPTPNAPPAFEFKPFEKYGQNKAPEWWTAFTALKHDRTQHLRETSLGNVIQAYGGAFIMLIFAHREFATQFKGAEFFRLFTPLFLKPTASRMVAQRAFSFE